MFRSFREPRLPPKGHGRFSRARWILFGRLKVKRDVTKIGSPFKGRAEPPGREVSSIADHCKAASRFAFGQNGGDAAVI
jgi:hypothetical protein